MPAQRLRGQAVNGLKPFRLYSTATINRLPHAIHDPSEQLGPNRYGERFGIQSHPAAYRDAESGVQGHQQHAAIAKPHDFCSYRPAAPGNLDSAEVPHRSGG